MSNYSYTNKRSQARPNEYASVCKSCMNTRNPVGEYQGYLVANGYGTLNKVIHKDCPLPQGFMLRVDKGFVGYRWADIEMDPDMEFSTTGNTDTAMIDAALRAATGLIDVDEPAPPREPTEQELQKAVKELLKATTDDFLALVPPLVRDTMLEATRTVEIKIAKQPSIKIQNAHKALADVVMCVEAGTNPFLVGPAGSGKTTLAKQVADVLKRKFYAENRVTSEYKLLGYMDATGKYVRTQFREAFEKGGGFLLDEVDASDPDVLTTFNSALANHMCPFPDKMITAHKDFFAIAAGNTYGRGADRQYVGRNQLDAATLDRFVVVEVDYDEEAELHWAGDADWTRYVQRIRAAIEAEKVRHIVSPRASIFGAQLLAAGMERKLVEERVIWKGLDITQRNRVTQRVGG